MTYKIAIIGGGPAGMACAIQLKRYGLEPVVFEKDQLGGLLRNANLVENYPGFPGGTSGPDLVTQIIRQFETFHIEVIRKEVLSLDHQKEIFSLKTKTQNFSFPVVVVASGTSSLKIDEKDLPGLIFYEVADLGEVDGKTIGIIGAGDAAFDYALNLASNNNQVRIFNRSAKIKALPLLIERAKTNKHIAYHPDHILEELEKQPGKTDKILLQFNVNNSRVSFSLDSLIFAGGRKPCLDFLSQDLLKRTEELQAEKCLFFIGDVKNDNYRQTSIATGDGLKAAMKIYTHIIKDQ